MSGSFYTFLTKITLNYCTFARYFLYCYKFKCQKQLYSNNRRLISVYKTVITQYEATQNRYTDHKP